MPSTPIPLASLSALERDAFVQALDGIFEHSPWVAHAAWAAGPFSDRDALLAALVAAMRGATRGQQLALIRAHPELAGRAAVRGELTHESRGEQSGAGLDACSPEEFERLQNLNAAYLAKFGFPFILAVRGYDRRGIIERFAARLEHSPEAEFDEALTQIARIAALRLADRVA
ncbi:2-oxo-4-hydroxy-4-carboxy-5-ureidoimidazoline decarboxylase [Niveibacterium sp. 24ML]|uniref:2-oxo-4-hydroxy-4-carboxy-5-ureidoimidazoline decarboxylase n=1 Tax=Niveibacterium sp. 24ML TaxID=2985512 RepID=UPI00226F99D7|nr:2-oxo-4-hydroxy-4-carboxy-5-ureidoimidazoline decarboxylase [Niveibacterium sp. 24ML]MCX9154533.1 2-oxo-4-hydroxy-4-carboxy-5-ureidoimidazoline decarboxylase [Niveibacterium sp. 24ML]